MKSTDRIVLPKLNPLQDAALRRIKERDMVSTLLPNFPIWRAELMAHIIVSHLDGNYDSDLDFLEFSDMKDLHNMMPHQSHSHVERWQM